MFFRHVVGKVQLYPYLHIVTWGLPKRYLGLLRIFNLPLEEFPHHFITQTSETFNSYELQVTKKSISSLQPNNSTNEFTGLGTIKEEKTIQNVELDQEASSNPSPPKKSGRRSKKKPVISIRVKLDDDLRNLKSANGKNFDKILSRCSRKSCMLVIEKSENSKHDEYSLNFVNNSNYGKSYSKLIRKNRRKRETGYYLPLGESKKSLASEFSEENIFPSLKRSEKFEDIEIHKNKTCNLSSPEHNSSETEIYKSSNNTVDHIKSEKSNNDTREEMNTNKTKEKDEKIKNTQLAIPSHLIPYEEPAKPLRNWPTLTKLFDDNHMEIYKMYLKSLSSQKEEDIEEETQETTEENDGFVSIDIKEAKAFHESLRQSPIYKEYNPTNLAASNTQEIINIVNEEETSENFKSPNSQTQSSAKRNYFDKINEDYKSDRTYSIEKSVVTTNYSVVSEKFPNADHDSQRLYTSTAYLLISGTNDKSKFEGKMNTFNGGTRKEATSSESDLMAKTRLLSSSMKTYESIAKNDEEETGNFEEKALTESNNNNNARKKKGMRKLYFFNIVLALFVTVVLGIILFISFADNTTINGVLQKYIER